MENLQAPRKMIFTTCYVSNSVSAYIPQEWAQESLAILEENMVAANLVHRDFEDVIANFGDTVNTRRPGTFTALRKTDDDDVTDQAATATNVQVVLDQLFHVTFVIKDGQQSKSFKNLVEEFLAPAMLAHAQAIDRVVLGQYPRIIAAGNVAGHLGTAITAKSMVDTQLIMNKNKAFESGRNLILNPQSHADALGVDLFVQAQQSWDQGTAVKEAWIGRKFGMNTYMCQNMGYYSTGNTLVTGAVNLAAGYAAGTTTMIVDGLSAAIGNNSWFTVAGDDTPQNVVSTVGGATPTSITFLPGLKHAVVDNAVVSLIATGLVNQAVSPTGYAVGWNKAIIYDGYSGIPQVGQFLTFGTTQGTSTYTIIAADATTITLDRSLDAAIADNAVINFGPLGNYNLAFHRDAIALVTRPLAVPRDDIGARSAVVNYNGLSIRVVMTYDGKAQGTRVTLDLLAGIQVLNTALACVMVG